LRADFSPSLVLCSVGIYYRRYFFKWFRKGYFLPVSGKTEGKEDETVSVRKGCKIRRIEAIPLSCKLKEVFGFSQAWVKKRETVLVKIVTDDGLQGYGECFGPGAGNREIIEGFFAPILKDQDPQNIEGLWELMYKRARAAFQSFIPMTALSGIDIALWDIKGQILRMPIFKLLGGNYHEKIKAYATGHYFKKTRSAEELFSHIIAEALENVKAGFDMLKLKIGLGILNLGVEKDIELVQRVRDAVGKEVALMVDANYAYDVPTAIFVGKRLEESRISWFEEPIDPIDVEGHKALKAAINIPIAAGECLATRYGFKDFFAQRAIDIAQPDLCAAGGITECRKIADMAKAYHIQFIPHVWGSPVAITAALHLLASIPNVSLLEFDRSSNPIREEMEKSLITREGSYVKVPEKPGLGIKIDESSIRQFMVS
jgi:D-galactarolactone cycloisomerase